MYTPLKHLGAQAMLFSILILSGAQLSAQNCTGTSASFTWDIDGTWESSLGTPGNSKTYTVGTVNMTLELLSDPGQANLDNSSACPSPLPPCDDSNFNLQTESNGGYGYGYLTFAIVADNCSEDKVTLKYSFSEPIQLNNFVISDIDDIDIASPNSDHVNSYIDAVDYNASLAGTAVDLSYYAGSNISVEASGSQLTAIAIRQDGINGDISPNAADGTMYVSSNGLIDEFTITYYNDCSDGVRDNQVSGQAADLNGYSNGQAIRIGGIDACIPSGASLSGQVLLDANNNGSGDHPLSEVLIQLFDNLGNYITETYTDLYGNYFFTGLSAGTYQATEVDPGNYESVNDTEGANDNMVANIVLAPNSASTGNDFVDAELPPVFEIVKTSNANSAVYPGDTIDYEVVITNHTNQTITNVTMSDNLPTYLSYISGTARKVYPTGAADQSGTANITLPTTCVGGLYSSCSTSSSQTATATTADGIPTGAELSSISFSSTGTTNGQTFVRNVNMTSVITPNNSTVDSKLPIKETLGSIGGVPWSYDSGNLTASGTALGNYTINWSYAGPSGTTARADASEVTMSINWIKTGNRDYSAPEATSSEDPTNFVPASDGITLLPGESLTVTYQTKVADQIPSNVLSLTNEASGNSDQTSLISTDLVVETYRSLPITLDYFKLIPDEIDVQLHWRTISETNNSHFEIERSQDGVRFEKIGITNSKATTKEYHQALQYRYVDQDVFNKRQGNQTWFYRIKQLDYDGKFSYTPIRSVHSEQMLKPIQLFPNPVRTGSEVRINAEEIETITVYDLFGRVIQRKIFDAARNEVVLSTKDWSAGNYIVHINHHQSLRIKVLSD